MFPAFENCELKDTQIKARNVKELLQAIAYAQKLFKIELTLGCFIVHSLEKLLLEIDLHRFLIVTLCFTERYKARCRLDKKFLSKLNWLSLIPSHNPFYIKIYLLIQIYNRYYIYA